MGLWNRLLGYPDFDPSGQSKAFFYKFAFQATQMFFRGDIQRAQEHIEKFAGIIREKGGDHHPDLGRTWLLSSIFLATATKYADAKIMCDFAIENFKHQDFDISEDFEPAIYLNKSLDRISSGHLPKDDNYTLIDHETPIGQWLLTIKQKNN